MNPEQKEAFRLRQHTRRSKATSLSYPTVQSHPITFQEKQAAFSEKARLSPKLEEKFREKFARRDAERQEVVRDEKAKSAASIPDFLGEIVADE